ncbi:YbaK/EbsC family protein [Tsukamurella sputi]|uniref:YbaK/EbsC family protein n=1 Tax=Tsukamurella sputi TaxID=2591848 RepID=UPI001407995C|nr:YbaK/EbsC family protein [Tsukamurella sputi]
MTEQYSARTESVRAALLAAGHPDTIRHVPDGAKTAAEAAAALGCEVGAIANSLVFLADGAPLLVLSSGRHRVDTAGLAERLGHDRISRATPDEVLAATGQVIGGVSPVGHPSPLVTVIDESLAAYPDLFAAAGTHDTLFRTDFAALVALTGARIVTTSAA